MSKTIVMKSCHYYTNHKPHAVCVYNLSARMHRINNWEPKPLKVVGFSKLLCQGVMSSPVRVPNHLIIPCSWNLQKCCSTLPFLFGRGSKSASSHSQAHFLFCTWKERDWYIEGFKPIISGGSSRMPPIRLQNKIMQLHDCLKRGDKVTANKEL